MKGIDPNWLPAQGKPSGKHCLKTRPQGKPLPPIPRTRADRRKIKAQARASARNVARLEVLVAGFRQLRPATREEIESLLRRA